MHIVLITRDRPELTIQTIQTMEANAVVWDNHTLTVVFDDTLEKCLEWRDAIKRSLNIEPFFNVDPAGSQLGVGGAKNLGAELVANRYTPTPEDIIMFSDNDMYYLKGWDDILEHALTSFGRDFSSIDPKIIQLGGWRHPFHGRGGPAYFDPNDPTWADGVAYEVDAVTGNCFVMRWADWEKYGPFDANALGPGQSEDYALSQKIKADNGLVAALDPPVAIHCGLSNCLGEPATGWREMSTLAEEQIIKHDIQTIWLSTPEEGTIQLERRGSYVSSASGISGRCDDSFDGSNRTLLNIGSGQRRFDTTKGWINIDVTSRPPDQVPDLVLNANALNTVFEANSVDMVVMHHILEHFGCGEADEVIKQCYQVLRPGGSLLIFVPDMRKLAARWLGGEINEYIFMVNTYGAFQGEDGDRHKWGYSYKSLNHYLSDTLDPLVRELPFGCTIKPFNWRDIPGADIARDWWVLGIEVVK
jgi:SAM-dependent methyltransferase